MAITYSQIGTTVIVGSGGSTTISFTSIPSSYTDLVVVTSIRSSVTGSAGAGYQERLNILFNGATTNYSERWMQAEAGTTVNTGTAYFNTSGTVGLAGTAVPSDWTSNTFNNNQIYIPNYSSASIKTYSIDGVAENNSAYGSLMMATGSWNDTAAISSISLSLRSSPNMVQYSSASLYGIKKS